MDSGDAQFMTALNLPHLLFMNMLFFPIANVIQWINYSKLCRLFGPTSWQKAYSSNWQLCKYAKY